MNKCHSNLNWLNDTTPAINDTNLNYMDGCIDTLDDRVVAMDSSKLGASDVANVIKGVSLDEDTGIYTYTRYNDTTFTIDSSGQYDELKEVVDRNTVSIDNRIKKFYTSNLVSESVSDSDDGAIRDLKIYGKSSQIQYSGKNLLNPTLQTTTSNGVTCTRNGDGTYTLNGTATSNIFFEVGNVGQVSNVKMVGCPPSGSAQTYYLIFLKNGSWSDAPLDIGSGTDTFSSDYTSNVVKITCISGVTYNNIVFKPMITNNTSATYNDYEPYVGGSPSPSPTYPQTIHSVVNPKIEVGGGKNLWNPNTSLERFDLTGSGVYRYGHSFEGGKKYTVIYKVNDAQTSVYYRVVKADLSDRGSTVSIPQNTTVNVTIPSGYILWVFCGDTDKEILAKMFVAKGTNVEYTDYIEATASLSNLTLNAIPVSTGGNVTINGQQYIADYVDIARKKVVRNIGKINLGTLNLYYTNNYSYFAATSLIPCDAVMLCQNYRCVGYLRDISITSADNNTISVFYDRTGLRIINHTYTNDDLVDGKAPFLNGIYLYYKLDTPTETDLTDEQIADFLALRSYYGTTNATVTSDDINGASEFLYPCSIENFVEYVKTEMGDTREFIYDISDISEQAFINAQYAEVMLELSE